MAFFDGYAPTAEVLALVERLVRPGGVLLTTNLGLDGEFRQVLAGNPAWSTRFLDEDTCGEPARLIDPVREVLRPLCCPAGPVWI